MTRLCHHPDIIKLSPWQPLIIWNGRFSDVHVKSVLRIFRLVKGSWNPWIISVHTEIKHAKDLWRAFCIKYLKRNKANCYKALLTDKSSCVSTAITHPVNEFKSIHALCKNINTFAMLTDDALLCHFRKGMYHKGIGSCALLSLMYSWLYTFMYPHAVPSVSVGKPFVDSSSFTILN